MKPEDFRLGATAVVVGNNQTGYHNGEVIIMKGVYWSWKTGCHYVLTKSLRDQNEKLSIEGNISLSALEYPTTPLEKEMERIKSEINSEGK
jgi:hypothetical protein